ncbi:TPA: hypothetical protein ACU2YK_002650 [Staphylococcus aureus]
MKIYSFNQKKELRDSKAIEEILFNYNIDSGSFNLKTLPFEILDNSLSDVQRKNVLEEYSDLKEIFSNLKSFRNDLVILTEDFEYTDFILKKFSPIHYHFENEYWYLLDGECEFGFLLNDGNKILVTLEKGEFIKVPEGTWQWFDLTENRNMAAMRFFYKTKNSPKVNDLIKEELLERI